MANQIFEYDFKALGTEINLRLVTLGKKQSEKAREDCRALEKFYADQEQIFSRFRPSSELSTLNKQIHSWCGDCRCDDCCCQASEDMQAVAAMSLIYHEKSQGFFDPRIIEYIESAGYRSDFKTTQKIPFVTRSKNLIKKRLKQHLAVQGSNIRMKARMDFSGIAKGYITDQAAKYLKSEAWESFLIDSGGDMYLSGTNSRKQSWCISVEGAFENELLLELSNCAIATSGISRRKWEVAGQRFHHLINPKKPTEFSFDLRSVTVVAGSVVEADIWAKVLFLKGRQAGLSYANQQGIKSIFLDYTGAAYISEAIKPNLYKS